ncbi:glycosyltransferase [Salipaludibacillus sp. HK11]|uniref:glycosyltransferase n=1 Tax=Salipaludibacillus sp. HK11 TaxID=3394320 RepID=UPI0039FD2CB0
MKNILISSFDMEVGGVERSLVNLLENFNYYQNDLDLFLYKHSGDFLSYIPKQVCLLPEVPEYTTFRKSINEIIKERYFRISRTRIKSKINAEIKGKLGKISEPGYLQMQLMWKYSLPYLPRMHKVYDVAISYLWPHYFVAEKVKANVKVAWIHTDFSSVETDERLDLYMWNKFNHIIAVSEECKNAFTKKYPSLLGKVTVMENIQSPSFIRSQAKETSDLSMANDSRFKIITVARLSHAKGIDLACEAMKVLIEDYHMDIAWYIVGYGGDEPQIKALIKKHHLEKNIILLGKKINPYPYMKAADIYVQPSRYEGKAVTVGEAQILSKPVLITNYPTAKSQVIHGINGYICKLSGIGIAEGISVLVENETLRKKLSRNCFQQDFSNTSELEKLYNFINGGEVNEAKN